MSQRNLGLLRDAAGLLKPLLGELVFVGGCTTALFITDTGAAEVRPTYDVDAIAEITSYAAYAAFADQLRNLGFTEDTSEGAPICRWRQEKTVLDVIPLDPNVLGFSNRWYKPAMDAAQEREIEAGLRIRVVDPVYFCATKLEAFAGRGKGDFQSSHDLEDLMAVVDGREELLGELQAAEETVCHFVAAETHKLLNSRAFLDAIPGYLLPDPASQARMRPLIERLHRIAVL
jgi:predicted nucleotidyltransferase